MKGRIVGLGGLLLILVLLLSMWSCQNSKGGVNSGVNARKIITNDKPNPQAQKIPDVQFTTLDGKPFTRKDLDKKTTMFFLFNSLCHHCQDNAKNLVKHANQLKGKQVILFSSEPIKALKTFDEAYEMNKYDNYRVMQIEEKKIFDYFGHVMTPSVFIYNRHHELVQKINGNTFFEFILNNVPVDQS
ncbi:peroxiredoxin family protein [Microscilla marina]|nr:redoxin domain-containing protein [Microscilla marina]